MELAPDCRPTPVAALLDDLNEPGTHFTRTHHGVPEIAEGIVEIKAIAREPGRRSKVAVTSHNPNVDPIGACIGHKGQRIQAVSAELGREKVDIILWSKDPKEFIRNALSPAQVGSIELDPEAKKARVKVTKDQHSLAIGTGGQNVRLASKLTGYDIHFEEAEISDLDEALRDSFRIVDTVAGQAVLGIATLAVFAFIVALCSESDAFVAASLTAFSDTAKLVFLVVGPAMDLKLASMEAGQFGRAFAVRFVPLVVLTAIGSAVLVGGWLL